MSTLAGRKGEDLALAYLERKGMTCLCRNYRRLRGEIDLIMKDGKYTVFVEVKARRSRRYGDPIESVTRYKIRHIRYAASSYIREKRLFDDPIRFDIVEILMPYGGRPKFHHVRNAF